MINKVVFLTVIFCLLFVVDSVDRNRFKTCSKSGFCNRNRDYADQEGLLSPYEVVEGSISKTSKRIMADLVHKENGEKFLLVITNYKNNIIRVRVTEKAPLYKRYEVEGVLLDIEKEDASDDGSLLFNKVKITESPFELQFFSDESTEVIRVNSRGLFNIEHYREKKEEEEKQEEEENKSKYKRMDNHELWNGK